MEFTATAATLEDIVLWRDMYRLEMACQIVHDSIHVRRGWTDEYMLFSAGTPVGYASVAVGGAVDRDAHRVRVLRGTPSTTASIRTVSRSRSRRVGAVSIVVQSNAVLATTMLHTFAGPATSESVLFHDKVSTSHRPLGATFRRADRERSSRTFLDDQLRWHGVVEVEGHVAASGRHSLSLQPALWRYLHGNERNCFAAEVLAHFSSRS